MAFENQEPPQGVWSIFGKHFKEACDEGYGPLDCVGLGMVTYALATAIRQTYKDMKPPAP